MVLFFLFVCLLFGAAAMLLFLLPHSIQLSAALILYSLFLFIYNVYGWIECFKQLYTIHEYCSMENTSQHTINGMFTFWVRTMCAHTLVTTCVPIRKWFERNQRRVKQDKRKRKREKKKTQKKARTHTHRIGANDVTGKQKYSVYLHAFLSFYCILIRDHSYSE